ncbi:MAG: ATP-binding protein [Moorea sp. SIO4G2]|nr:ATP-binding protein [Moorena sp. SIO4G2]
MIDEFIAKNSKGYFTIEADPGVGKSAIIAKYVQNTGCIAYFNLRSGGVNKAKDFLEHICLELIQRYELNPSWPSNATENNYFLSSLLQQASDRSVNSKPVVIAVDALDEVDTSSQAQGSNILYLPKHLPEKVFFILAHRKVEQVKIPLELDSETPHQSFDLMAKEYCDQSFKDVNTYITNRIQESQLVINWITSKKLTVEEFIEQLSFKSESNFMYLVYVFKDIEQRDRQDFSLKNLPQGLKGYYEKHWNLMGMNAQPEPLDKITIVSILVSIDQPISCHSIAQESAVEELTVNKVLKDWKQFLHKQHLEKKVCYSIYHNSFRDFLNSKDEVRIARGEAI